MKIKHLEAALEIKSTAETGTFSGYASVFDNIDHYRDIVKKGAFAESLKRWAEKGRLPPILWQHNRHEPIGVFTKMEEDGYGLRVEGRLLIDDVPQAKAAQGLLKAGALGGLSIGYITLQERRTPEDNYELLEVDLKEVSIVTFPANEAATVNDVKTLVSDGGLPSLPEFEKFLRDAGFSKAQATAVASHGLRQLLRDAAEPEAKSIERALNILKGTSHV